MIIADLDSSLLRDVRRRLPALDHRRARQIYAAGAEDERSGRVTTAVDKRRVILDAAVRVFARQGFHTCRVSDIADEAGVAYGLVYHYFPSKEAILDTLFLERWDVMLAAIAEADASDRAPREKLTTIASFIIDSYRHDPDLMKVIIVEVTRAANTFGRTHLEQDHAGIRRDRADRQAGSGRRERSAREVDALFAAQAFYGLIEQVLTQWIFGEPAGRHGGVRARQDGDRRDHLRRTRRLIRALCNLLEWRRDEGESLGQAPALVRSAGRSRCAVGHRRSTCRGSRLA